MCLAVLFFFNDTATTEIYTLSLHDALPIFIGNAYAGVADLYNGPSVLYCCIDHHCTTFAGVFAGDRKSTRLNSSHANISYAVFCLKKKKTPEPIHPYTSLFRHNSRIRTAAR